MLGAGDWGLVSQAFRAVSSKEKVPNDICLNEFGRAFNTAINVGFGSKMDDGIDVLFCKQVIEQFTITDISTHETIAWVIIETGKVGQIAGIGQVVDIYDSASIETFQDKTNKVGAYETTAPGNEYIIQNYALSIKVYRPGMPR